MMIRFGIGYDVHKLAPNQKYFASDELPALDDSRSTLAQIKMCFAANRADVWETQFD